MRTFLGLFRNKDKTKKSEVEPRYTDIEVNAETSERVKRIRQVYNYIYDYFTRGDDVKDLTFDFSRSFVEEELTRIGKTLNKLPIETQLEWLARNYLQLVRQGYQNGDFFRMRKNEDIVMRASMNYKMVDPKIRFIYSRYLSLKHKGVSLKLKDLQKQCVPFGGHIEVEAEVYLTFRRQSRYNQTPDGYLLKYYE
jgi:hypothetical protein